MAISRMRWEIRPRHRRRPQQAGDDDRQPVFIGPDEYDRGDDRVEQPAQGAADAHGDVELGQGVGIRPQPHQLTMTGERQDEECQQVKGVEHPHRTCQLQGDEGDHQHVGLGPQNQTMTDAPAWCECHDVGDQIERQRQHPQQRHRGDVGRQMGGNAEQQARRREREHGPMQTPAPGYGFAMLAPRNRLGRGAGGAKPDAAQQHEQGEHRVADGPCVRLITQAYQRLDQERIGNQCADTAQIAEAVEKVGIVRTRVTAEAEPALQQRRGRRHRQERQADRHRQFAQQPQDRNAVRRRRCGDGDRQDQERDQQDAGMQRGLPCKGR